VACAAAGGVSVGSNRASSRKYLSSASVGNGHDKELGGEQTTTIDLLAQAAAYVRPLLDRSNPLGQRLRTLWAAVVGARDLGASDVVEEEFLRLARDSGLFTDLGQHADADLRHVIRWAMLNRNPFQ
jgi:hypothetical protein